MKIVWCSGSINSTHIDCPCRRSRGRVRASRPPPPTPPPPPPLNNVVVYWLVVALCGFSPSHLPPPPPPILPLLLNDNDVRGIVVKMPATPPITHYLSDCHRLSLRPFQWLIVVVAIRPLDVAIVARSVPFGGGCGGLRVATARQFISSKIDALTSPASTARCDATAKEGHVNCDVSDVPVKARAAPTTGSGCHGSVLARARRCE